MPYRATNDVVRRVMPLIDRLASRSIDKARLLQYLSAKAGSDWNVHELIKDEEVVSDGGFPVRQLTFRDRLSNQESVLQYPDCLSTMPIDIEILVVEEYKRLAVDRPLTLMNPTLFKFLFQAMYCDHCQWQGADHIQIQRECYFAGHPVNFEPSSSAQ